MANQTSLSWEAQSNDGSTTIEPMMQNVQKFLSQLPEAERNKLLAPYTNPSPSTPIYTQRASRGKSPAIPSHIQGDSRARSTSRKRRNINHADQEDNQTNHGSLSSTNNGYKVPSYTTVPIFLQNSFPTDIKQNPKKLENLLYELKPQAKIKSIQVCKSGDLKLTAQTPHDENILRQNWPQDRHGPIKPRLPKEKTADQAVIIHNIPPLVTNGDIKERLQELLIEPKDIYRFNKKGSQEPSMNVKVTLGSKADKDHLISHGFGIFSQHFKVSEAQSMPNIVQCYKCQKFGHNFFECQATTDTCLRCAASHSHRHCTEPKENSKCSTASYSPAI